MDNNTYLGKILDNIHIIISLLHVLTSADLQKLSLSNVLGTWIRWFWLYKNSKDWFIDFNKNS